MNQESRTVVMTFLSAVAMHALAGRNRQMHGDQLIRESVNIAEDLLAEVEARAEEAEE